MMEAPTMGIDMIRKRDGREVPFDQDKIEQAISRLFRHRAVRAGMRRAAS